MNEFRKAHREESKRLEEERAKGGITAWAMGALGFLRPLSLLLPVTIVTPEGKKRRNWSLFLLAAGYGSMISLKVNAIAVISRAPVLMQVAGRRHPRVSVHVVDVRMDVEAGRVFRTGSRDDC